MVLSLSKKSFDEVLLGAYLFILIFAPPFMPYPHILLSVLSIVLINTKYLYLRNFVLNRSGLNKWIILIAGLTIYTMSVPLCVSIITGDILPFSHYLTVFNRYFVLTITVVPCSCLIICKLFEHDWNVDFLFRSIMIAGLAESVCSVLAYINPSIKNIFIELMRRNTDSELYHNEWYITVRSYGFSRTLVDLFGLGMALIAIICLIYGVIYNINYVFVSIMVELSAALNARTGIIIYGISLALAMIYLFVKRKYLSFCKMCIITLLLFLAARKMLFFLSISGQATSNWMMTGIMSVVSLFNSKGLNVAEGNAVTNLVTRNNWSLPEGIRLLIGTGHSLYGAEGYNHSDIGYVNDIWVFGLLGVILLYGFMLSMCVDVNRKSDDIVVKYISIACAVSFFVFNIKGAAFSYNPGMIVMLTILFVNKFFINCEERRNYNW